MAAVPFADLPLAEQAQAAAAMVWLRSRLESVEAAAVRAFDAGGEWALDGHRSAAALTHRRRLPRADARRRVHLAAAWRCDADHIEPWNSANTTQRNGRLLCRDHHRLRERIKHPPFATRAPDGTLTHHRADGSPITGPPRTHG